MGGAERGGGERDEGGEGADEEGAVLNVSEAKESAEDAVRLQPGFTACLKPHQLGDPTPNPNPDPDPSPNLRVPPLPRLTKGVDSPLA